MAIEVEENDARAKIEALAKKLGYSTVAFLPVQGSMRLNKYVLAFKTYIECIHLDYWMTFMKCEKENYIGTMEDLLFEDNYWSHAIEKMEDVVKHGYSIESRSKIILNPNETIDEALIRLDLSYIEK